MKTMDNSHEINIVCPVCKKTKNLIIPSKIISQSKNLTTVSIPKNLVCEHHFQAFVDKNFKVRGYQKVDFDFLSDENDKNYDSNEIKSKKKEKSKIQEDKELLDNLKLDENFVEYNPKKKNNRNLAKKSQLIEEPIKREKFENQNTEETTLKDVYEEFWEFIDEDNETFQKFIKNDPRRK